VNKELNIEEKMITDEMISQIPAAISKLPKAEKETVSMAINEQLTPQAISTITGKNSNLTNTYIRRGKKKILKKIRG
jgi:DNA-directed RNA polymerase specialized sigma24 family protein